VGQAPAVLAGWRGRVALALVAIGLLAAYDATAMRFPDLSDWGDVLWTGIVLGVPVFGLLWLALPLARRQRGWLLAATGVLAAVAVAASLLDLETAANLSKLGAAGAAGFLFVSFFEHASWLVAVALAIPIADTISVWRGPTRYIVTQKPSYFEADSVAFPPPGERVVELSWDAVTGASDYVVVTVRPGHRHRFDLLTQRSVNLATDAHARYRIAVKALAGKRQLAESDIALPPECGCDVTPTRGPGPERLTLRTTTRPAAERLGLTDVVFFAVFLAGALRFRLRTGWTWVGLVLGVMLAGVAGLFDPFGIGGVPALPLISLGFLVPNADLLWRSVREATRPKSP
jgi:hypothetical protein